MPCPYGLRLTSKLTSGFFKPKISPKQKSSRYRREDGGLHGSNEDVSPVGIYANFT